MRRCFPRGQQGFARNERDESDRGMGRRPSTLATASLALFLLARATRADAADAAVGARGDGAPEATTTRPPRLDDDVPHPARVADAADAAALALGLPRSVGTLYSAESLVADRRPETRADRDDDSDPLQSRRALFPTQPPATPRAQPRASPSPSTVPVPATAVPVPSPAIQTLEAYLGDAATADPPPDADPADVAAAAAEAAEYLQIERALLAEYEAAMQEWRDAEAVLAAQTAEVEAANVAAEREARARGEDASFRAAADRERAWVASAPDLDAYAKSACTQTVHHKPVYVPGVYVPPKRAPSVTVPGTPPVFVPGAPAYWEPGRAPFYTPGFWTPGIRPRYVSAKPPVIVPAKKGTVIPGEFTPASYTPGFVIPGFHETTACAVPVCAPPCQHAPVIPPEVVENA